MKPTEARLHHADELRSDRVCGRPVIERLARACELAVLEVRENSRQGVHVLARDTLGGNGGCHCDCGHFALTFWRFVRRLTASQYTKRLDDFKFSGTFLLIVCILLSGGYTFFYPLIVLQSSR